MKQLDDVQNELNNSLFKVVSVLEGLLNSDALKDNTRDTKESKQQIYRATRILRSQIDPNHLTGRK